MFILAIYIVAALALTIFIHNEYYGWAFADIALGLGLLWWLGAISPLTWPAWVAANPTTILTFFGVYVAVAVLWAMFKWVSFVRPIAKQYIRLRTEFAVKNNMDVLSVSKLHLHEYESGPEADLFKDWCKSRRNYGNNYLIEEDDDGKPSIPAREHAGKITSWMFWWPVSMVNFIVGDLIVDFFNTLFNMLRGVFQKVGDRQFR